MKHFAAHSTLPAGLLATLLCSIALSMPLQAQDYDALIQQAVELRNKGDMEGAEVKLRAALQVTADKREAGYLLGMVLAFQERYREALQLLERYLQLYPDEVQLQLARARIIAYQGFYTEAAALTAEISRQQPDNLDAINLAGRIALYRSEPGQALTFFDAALAAEPDNLEALIGRHDAALALADTSAAEAALQRAERIAPDHIDVVNRRKPATSASQHQHELAYGFGRSDFSEPALSEWNDRFVEYRHLAATGNQEFLRVNHFHRFSRHDTQVEAGLSRGQNQRWPLELAVGVTNSANFLSDHYVRAGTRYQLNTPGENQGPAILLPSYQYSSYVNGNTHRLQFGLEYYLSGTDAWLAPAIGMMRDQNGRDTFAWSLSGHWQLNAGNRIGANYSDAPETENLLTTNTRNYGVYWRHVLSDNFSFTLSVARLEREASYDRTETSLVLQQRF